MEPISATILVLVASSATVVIVIGLCVKYDYSHNNSSKRLPRRLWRFWRWLNEFPFCLCCQKNTDFPSPATRRTDDVTFERLPSVLNSSQNFNLTHGLDRHDGHTCGSPISLEQFADGSEGSDVTLDRNRIYFSDSLGKGWFGWVIRGQFDGATVIVQVLKEEANPTEGKLFLETCLVATRSRGHPNVLGLVGVAVEVPPFLLVYEHCDRGDLKTFLINSKSVDFEGKHILLLGICRDIVCGLNHLHQKECVPSDLAARCCHLTTDMTAKIGDYGLARQTYPEDYLSRDASTTFNHSLSNAIQDTSKDSVSRLHQYMPLRWWPPEVLTCLRQDKAVDNLSKAASMWSLGVTLWEVAAFADVPFAPIHDHQFLCGALIRPGPGPGPLAISGVEAEAIQSVVDLCLQSDPESRPRCDRLLRYLTDMYDCKV